MSAKFVNLIEFFECKIFTQVKTVRFAGGRVDNDMIVPGIDAVDVRPDKELTVWQCRHGNAGMVDGHILFGIDLSLAIEEEAVHHAKRYVQAAHQPPGVGELGKANTYKEQDLGEAEEEV